MHWSTLIPRRTKQCHMHSIANKETQQIPALSITINFIPNIWIIIIYLTNKERRTQQIPAEPTTINFIPNIWIIIIYFTNKERRTQQFLLSQSQWSSLNWRCVVSVHSKGNVNCRQRQLEIHHVARILWTHSLLVDNSFFTIKSRCANILQVEFVPAFSKGFILAQRRDG